MYYANTHLFTTFDLYILKWKYLEELKKKTVS